MATPEPPPQEASAILDLALRVARQAGHIQREHYETEHRIETKSAAIDLVTEVDRQCEAAIVESIRVERAGDLAAPIRSETRRHDLESALQTI